MIPINDRLNPRHNWLDQKEDVMYINETDKMICDGKHDWNIDAKGRCWVTMTCKKCNARYERDSSD
jgi:hypothetical protein